MSGATSPAAPASLAGMEIQSINGVSATKIVEKMLAATSGDGDIKTNRMWRLGGWSFSSRLLTLMGFLGPYDVTLWDSKEKREIKVHLEGVNMARLQSTARTKFPQDERPKTAAELAFLDEGMIAVMKIHEFGGFVDAERKKPLEKFFQESFDAMDRKGTKKLVLDLRNNGGGEDELGKQLLSYLLDKPFKYYDDLVINAGVHLPEIHHPSESARRRGGVPARWQVPCAQSSKLGNPTARQADL